MRRQTDNHAHLHFHADRFCRINGDWYYSTRERQDVGPFPTQKLAQQDLDEYLTAIGLSLPKSDVEARCG